MRVWSLGQEDSPGGAHGNSPQYSCREKSPGQRSLEWTQFSSVTQSDSLWPHGLQHTRPPCPSPTPGAYSNSCPWSQWCHPTISSSVILFSSHLQSFPLSGSFPTTQFFASGGQNIEGSQLQGWTRLKRLSTHWSNVFQRIVWSHKGECCWWVKTALLLSFVRQMHQNQSS